MKTPENSKGTAKYIVGEVSRFDQKNEMFKRPRWQPELREICATFRDYWDIRVARQQSLHSCFQQDGEENSKPVV